MTPWTSEQIDLLQSAYAASGPGPVDLAAVAALVGRKRASCADKASALGLTNQSRGKVLHPKVRARCTPEELKRIQSAAAKRRIAEHGHPRGMLGKRHAPETLAVISTASRRGWASPTSGHNTELEKRRRSDWAATASFKRPAENTYSRCLRGRRADLGDRYFRSSWEANYARYLDRMLDRGEVVGWRYEPQTFLLDEVPQIRSYTPDFEVTYADGRSEWHEVKGWMDPRSVARLDQMASYYPREVIRVIGPAWFKQAKIDGLDEQIPNWEKPLPRAAKRAA